MYNFERSRLKSTCVVSSHSLPLPASWKQVPKMAGPQDGEEAIVPKSLFRGKLPPMC